MILITGASSGIGAATARAFARAKRPLILWARRRERLESLKKECLALGAPEVLIAVIDVRDASAITEETRLPHYARVDVLVNNAGLARGLSPFQSDEPSHWDDMIDTNLKGVLNVTHALLPYLLKKNSGHIVNVGSVAGRWYYPKGHVYCATKAAVHALNEGLRLDLVGTNIRVTEISPGMVETEFSNVRLEDDAKAKQVYAGLQPLVAEDVAETILWCCQRPAHVNVQELVLYPTAQASPTVVHRKS